MKLSSRQEQILEILQENKRASVNKLSEILFFSKMTIRRDLAYMEKCGFLTRYHGGAIIKQNYLQYPIEMRRHIHEKEKLKMAELADKHIEDDQVIFLPGSSTCSFIIPYLKNYEDLHIVTNSVKFMLQLSKMQVKCTLSGGEYNESQHILVGRSCERFFRSINTDIAIVSCDGISDDGIISVSNEKTAEIVMIGLKNASKKNSPC